MESEKKKKKGQTRWMGISKDELLNKTNKNEESDDKEETVRDEVGGGEKCCGR